MVLARVDGNVVATAGHPTMRGWRLLICQPLNDDGSDRGEPVMAIDNHGAALHQKVIFTTDGKATREAVNAGSTPLRNMVVAIVDDTPAAAS